MMQAEISSLERDDMLTGSINGSNVHFYTDHKIITDWDFDKTINASDVYVYGWGDLDDYDTKTSLSVESVNQLEGRINLSSGPSSTFEAITADYRWSLYEHNYDLVDLATAYLAGFLYLNAMYMEVPSSTRLGAQSYSYRQSPAMNALNAFYKTLQNIRTQQISEGTKKGTSLKGVG
jgi:hypothetical protein